MNNNILKLFFKTLKTEAGIMADETATCNTDIKKIIMYWEVLRKAKTVGCCSLKRLQEGDRTEQNLSWREMALGKERVNSSDLPFFWFPLKNWATPQKFYDFFSVEIRDEQKS